MKVKELIKKLESLDPEANVKIPATFTYVTVGPAPAVSIDHVGKGIDWDNDIVNLYANKTLVALSPEQYQHFMTELRKADKHRAECYKKGIKDSKLIEAQIDPLFRKSGE